MEEKSRGGRQRTKRRVCPYADSCFDCPMPDCVMPSDKMYNDILTGRFMAELLGHAGGEKEREKEEKKK